MNKRFNLYSLRYRMIIALVVSLSIGGAVFILLTTTADYLIVEHYLSEAAYEERAQSYVDRFQRYVREKNLLSTDSAALQDWVRQNPYNYISLYNRSGVVWESGWWDESAPSATEIYASASTIAMESTEADKRGANALLDVPAYYQWLHQIEFQDGTFWISVTDFSDEPLYDMVHRSIIAFSAFLVFPLVLFYAGKISRRVIRLTREVGAISAGNLDGPITKKGRDEIAALAEGVDTMRRSVIEQLEKEQIAWRANSDLITSMSHDIRTPLTVLMGYTGLIKNNQYGSPEELRSYIEVIDKKAVQLKELSDKLFRYFLVFGDTERPVLEAVPAKELLAQVLGEHIVLLTDSGFRFAETPLEEDCVIRVKLTYFKRLFDNIFSNIEKYADPAAPCAVVARPEEGTLTVSITNGISKDASQAESTKIGLKTCARIMEQMGGSFLTAVKEERFTATLFFPIIKSE